MRIICFLVAALLWVAPVHAGCDFTPTDWTLLGTYSVVVLRDWEQTRDIAAHDNRVETNPILGKNPSPDAINRHFAAYLGIVWGAACLMPNDARLPFLGTMIVLHFSVTQHNARIGLRSSF